MPFYEETLKQQLPNGEMVDIAACDPRLESLGVSVISFRENYFEKAMRASSKDGSIEFFGDKEYHVFRLLRYVVEVALSVRRDSRDASPQQ